MSKPIDLNKLIAEPTANDDDSMVSRVVLRDVATFDSTGVEFIDLQRVNFIYGGNGCGKTTFSRVMASKKLKSEFPRCRVEWTGQPLQVLVYNKDFRERNLVENIPGVFTLGEASVEAVHEIERLRLETAELDLRQKEKRDRASRLMKAIHRQTTKHQEYLWDNIYLAHQEFAECLKGIANKEHFERLMSVQVMGGNFRHPKEADELQARYIALYDNDNSPVRISPMAMPDEALAKVETIAANPVWQRLIMGSERLPIAKLIKRLRLHDWVRRGKEAMGEGSDVCPFCQQHTVTVQFRAELEEFFNVDYQQNLNEISALMGQYEEASRRLVAQLKGLGIYRVLRHNYEFYDALVAALESRLETNRHIMQNKYRNPSMAASFKKIDREVEGLRRLLAEANRAIDENNRAVDNMAAVRQELGDDVMAFLASLCAGKVMSHDTFVRMRTDDVKALSAEAAALQRQIEDKSREIKKRESLLASMQPTIDSINNALRKFGFTSFSIQPAKRGNYYQIQRDDGSLANQTLSEGEMTFLTFLYYMQLVKGGVTKNGLNEPKVLVIDDPISSLDSNVLYVVSTMLRQLLKEVRGKGEAGRSRVRQVFVLSHNVFFYKDVTFINARTNRQRDTHHWVLHKSGKVSGLRACGQENTIHGMYEQLWQDLKEGSRRMDNVSLQNTMRRIIETYFIMMGGCDKRRLIPDNFSDDPEELAIVTSLAKWADEGSHSVADDLFMEAQQITNERYMEVFRRLFVKLGHEAHYKMMMKEN